MTLEHATHTTYKITRFDSEEWLNYNKKERSKPLKNEPNCLKPETAAAAFSEEASEDAGKRQNSQTLFGKTDGKRFQTEKLPKGSLQRLK